MQLDWDAAINSIRESLPQTQFQNWISPVEYIRNDETCVVLGVPSRFHEDWVRNHYGEQIRRAIQTTCGSALQLEFEILVRQSNEEAAEASPLAPLPATHTQTPARPQLRIVDKNEQSTLPEIAPSTAPEAPRLPPFHHPLFEFGFNRLAFQCVGLFAETAENRINPLILLGGIGMGKTHHLSEIGHRLHKRFPDKRIRYTNAESFTYDYIRHIRSNDIVTFKKLYTEQTDILLFDDVHGIANKTGTQETLLHVFNDIVSRGGKVAFTTTIAPQRLQNFIEPLKSRLTSGVMAEIKPLSFEEKVEILGQMAAVNQISVEGPVLRSLADKGQKDIRDLIGTLLRVHLQAKLDNRVLTGDYIAQEVTGVEPPREAISMGEIVALVEHHLGVPRTELMSKSRKGATTWARQVAMYLARTSTLLSLEEIGKTFDRDHATVIHAFEKVKEAQLTQPARKYEVDFLKRKLAARAPRAFASEETELPGIAETVELPLG